MIIPAMFYLEKIPPLIMCAALYCLFPHMNVEIAIVYQARPSLTLQKSESV